MRQGRVPEAGRRSGRWRQDVARVRLATGAYEEAEALYRRALAIDEKQGSEAPEVAYSLLGLAKVALARGRPADAVPLADRAVAILAGRQVAAHKLALGRLALAQALWAAPAGQGRDHDRALAQARSAREELRATKGEHKELAEVEAFLAKHGDSR